MILSRYWVCAPHDCDHDLHHGYARGQGHRHHEGWVPKVCWKPLLLMPPPALSCRESQNPGHEFSWLFVAVNTVQILTSSVPILCLCALKFKNGHLSHFSPPPMIVYMEAKILSLWSFSTFCLYVCPSVCQSVCLSFCWYICPSICQAYLLSVFPSYSLSVFPSVCQSTWSSLRRSSDPKSSSEGNCTLLDAPDKHLLRRS